FRMARQIPSTKFQVPILHRLARFRMARQIPSTKFQAPILHRLRAVSDGEANPNTVILSLSKGKTVTLSLSKGKTVPRPSKGFRKKNDLSGGLRKNRRLLQLIIE
ncbi:MAG: hypothetical protein NXH73_11425, partial [Flavobacteriaceae bacterium]|nr:hypothetical protein [Flavobacteriaceae bacterium]